MMLVDSHAHLDDPRFNDDRERVLGRAWDAGVRKILTIGNGSGPDEMGCGIAIAEAHDWIYTSAGTHPHDASEVEEGHYDLIEQLPRHPRVLAIGETGPVLPPVSGRARRLERGFRADPARSIADRPGMGPEEFAMRTSANFDRLFAPKHRNTR